MPASLRYVYARHDLALVPAHFHHRSPVPFLRLLVPERRRHDQRKSAHRDPLRDPVIHTPAIPTGDRASCHPDCIMPAKLHDHLQAHALYKSAVPPGDQASSCTHPYVQLRPYHAFRRMSTQACQISEALRDWHLRAAPRIPRKTPAFCCGRKPGLIAIECRARVHNNASRTLDLASAPPAALDRGRARDKRIGMACSSDVL